MKNSRSLSGSLVFVIATLTFTVTIHVSTVSNTLDIAYL